MICFDIKDLYVTIPTDETLNIIKKETTTKHQHSNNITNSLTVKSNLITELFHVPTKNLPTCTGISMGSPISSLIAVIILQHYGGKK